MVDRLLDEQWSAVEADWQEVYGMDLTEAVYGPCPVSARRVCTLTLALPPGSRAMRAVADEDPAWPVDRVLAGLVVERLDALHASFIRANGGKARTPELIVPRPKRRRPQGRAVPVDRMLAGLDAAMAGGDR